MSTNCTRNDNNTVTLTTVVEGENWKKAQNKALNRAASHASLKGFRKGKIPAAMIRKMFGAQAIRELAAEELADSVLGSLLDEYMIEPIGRPEFKPENLTDESAELVFIVPVAPTVDLENIDLKALGVEKHVEEITDQQVADELERLAIMNAEQVLDEDETPAADGDMVEIKRSFSAPEELVSDRPATPGTLYLGAKPVENEALEKAVLGAKPHTTVEYTETLPEDFYNNDLAGKEATVKVEIGDVYHLEKPSDEELPKLQTRYEDVETIDDLKNAIRKTFEERAKTNANNTYLDEVLNAIREKVDVDVPDSMVDDELERQLTETLLQTGLVKTREQLSGMLKMLKNDPGVMGEGRDAAAQRIVNDLILEAVAAKENLEVSEDELNKFLEDFAKEQKTDVETLKKTISLAAVRKSMLLDKAIDWLMGEDDQESQGENKEESSENE